MRLGIVGSRTFTDESLMREAILGFAQECLSLDIKIEAVVSGGAKGADSMAASLAREAGWEVIEHRPDTARYGWPRAAFERNTLIVYGTPENDHEDGSDALMAFFGPGEPPIRGDRHFGSGTMDTVTKAIAKRIPVHLYFQDQIISEP